jgi:hypothetical protein
LLYGKRKNVTGSSSRSRLLSTCSMFVEEPGRNSSRGKKRSSLYDYWSTCGFESVRAEFSRHHAPLNFHRHRRLVVEVGLDA